MFCLGVIMQSLIHLFFLQRHMPIFDQQQQISNNCSSNFITLHATIKLILMTALLIYQQPLKHPEKRHGTKQENNIWKNQL